MNIEVDKNSMKKTEKILLGTLASVAVAAGGFFAFQAIANPAPTKEQLALAEAGATHGEKGHSETKALLRVATEGLSGELDLSDEAQKHLFGEARGCNLDSNGALGGQWFISSWITAPKGDLEKLRAEIQVLKPELKGDLVEDDNLLILDGKSSERVTAKKLDSDTFEVTLASKCYGED